MTPGYAANVYNQMSSGFDANLAFSVEDYLEFERLICDPAQMPKTSAGLRRTRFSDKDLQYFIESGQRKHNRMLQHFEERWRLKAYDVKPVRLRGDRLNGVQCENQALDIYRLQTGFDVRRSGLISNRWLSEYMLRPDAFAFWNRKPCRLIEIKYPQCKETEQMTAREVVYSNFRKSLFKYINGERTLHPITARKSYTQCQFQMFVTNMPLLDMVVVSYYPEFNIEIVPIRRNDEFIRVKHAYFSSIYNEFGKPFIESVSNEKWYIR